MYQPKHESNKERFELLTREYTGKWGPDALRCFSAPGRVEIIGNHTDHNHGKVLAAAVDLDMIAVAAPSGDKVVTLVSEGYGEDIVVDLGQPAAVESEAGTTQALIRGTGARFVQLGYVTGGFKAVMSSRVLPGSGLSSSAAIEVLMGMIFNVLFNDGKIDAVELAKIGQYAENRYFMKPCGLMDQLACACGGVIGIDFEEPGNPRITRVNLSLKEYGYVLAVVDTGGSHADLTPEYASVPQEMKQIAGFFNKKVLREVDVNEIYGNIALLRREYGDRALLRALHFYDENRRVDMQVEALEGGNFSRFLDLVNRSGESSMKWLQNCFPASGPGEQGVMTGLKITRGFLQGKGASRVHGGGFAGTILVILPEAEVGEYIRLMEGVFDKGCVMVLDFREDGVAGFEAQ